MAIDFTKYGTVKPAGNTTPVDFSKYGKAVSNQTQTPDVPMKYDVAESRSDKISRLQEEARIVENESKKANSFTEKYVRPVADSILPGTASLGDTVGSIINIKGASNNYETVSKNLSDANLSLVKTIRERQAKGINTDDLKREYNKNIDQLERAKKEFGETTAGSQKSTKKVVGELGMTTLNVLTAGAYGKAAAGMKTASLSKAAPTALAEAAAVVKKPASLFSKQGLKRISLGAGLGESFDIAQNLQNEEEGSDILTKGYGKYVGAGLPLIVGAGKGVQNKFGEEGVRNSLGDVYRKVASKYRDASKVIERAETFHKTDPVGVLQMYGKETIPEMANGGASTQNARGFLKDQIKEYSTLRNDHLFLNDTKIQLPEYRQYANDLIEAMPGWSREKKDKIIAQVNKIIDPVELAYSNSPKNKGGLELNELGLIKTEQTDLSKSYNNKAPTFDYDAHAIVGKAARDLIEISSKDDVAVKDLNNLIQGHYDAIDLLNALEGKKIHGGQLSKMFNRLGGSIVGSAAGSVSGNPVIGAIVGNTIAGEVTNIVQNQFITNPIKRMLINTLKAKVPQEVEVAKKALETKYGQVFEELFQDLPSKSLKTSNTTKTPNPINKIDIPSTIPEKEIKVNNPFDADIKGSASTKAVIGGAGVTALGTGIVANKDEIKKKSDNLFSNKFYYSKPSLKDKGIDKVNLGESKPVEISAYSPTKDQTDDNPKEMASGKKIYEGAIATGDRTIPFGTQIYIPELDRVFVVEDRLNKRYEPSKYGKQIFDLLITETGETGRKKAKEFGRQNLTYVIVGHDGRKHKLNK